MPPAKQGEHLCLWQPPGRLIGHLAYRLALCSAICDVLCYPICLKACAVVQPVVGPQVGGGKVNVAVVVVLQKVLALIESPSATTISIN